MTFHFVREWTFHRRLRL